MRPRWWRWYGALEFDRPLPLRLALVPRLRTLPATGGLYPNNLACSEAADEFEIALPLAATTELVAGKLEAAEFADDIEATQMFGRLNKTIRRFSQDILRGIRHIKLQYN